MEYNENNQETETNEEVENTEVNETQSETTAFILVNDENDKESEKSENEEEKKEETKKEEPKIEIVSPKHSSSKKHTAGLLAGCLLVSCIGGVGGSLLVNHFSSSSSQPSIIYQSIERKDQDGNAVTNMSVKDVAANTSESVVEIQTEQVQFGNRFQQFVGSGAGSGVILSEDGYIVTNNHVIENARRVTVRTKNGDEYEARLIGTDPKTDLAVLKIEATGLKAAVLGDSDSIAVGDNAVVIGNPLGELGGTVTNGIISALDREITIDGETMRLLQTNAAINPGNSGGGMFNDYGELIGVINAKSTGNDVEGLGFAIPINVAKTVIKDLVDNGYVTNRPIIGVSLTNITDELTAFQMGVNELGVFVAEVTENGPADKAGMLPRDQIIEIDGTEVTSSEDVKAIIDQHNVGDTLEFKVVRNKREKKLSVTLEESIPKVENSVNS